MLGTFPHRTHGHLERFHLAAESALLTTGAVIATLIGAIVLLFALFGTKAY